MNGPSSTFWSDIRTIALQDMLQETGGYVQRRIFRWYSKTFATPLHQVDDLPLDFVLQHYFEAMWEALQKHEIEEEVEKIRQTPQQRWAAMMAADSSAITEDESEKKALEEVRKALLFMGKGGPKAQNPFPLEKKGPSIPIRGPKPLSAAWNPELDNGKKAPDLPSIKMDFKEVSDLEFDRVMDEDSTPETPSDAGNLAPETPRKPRRSSP